VHLSDRNLGGWRPIPWQGGAGAAPRGRRVTRRQRFIPRSTTEDQTPVVTRGARRGSGHRADGIPENPKEETRWICPGSTRAGGCGLARPGRDRGPGRHPQGQARQRACRLSLRAGLAAGEGVDPSEVPPTSVQVKLQARGSSPRQLAAGATGNVLVTMGPGKVKSGLVETLGGGILGQLTSKLNPFSAKDPYTRLDCTVIRIDVVDVSPERRTCASRLSRRRRTLTPRRRRRAPGCPGPSGSLEPGHPS
jgi:hypothetical protein